MLNIHYSVKKLFGKGYKNKLFIIPEEWNELTGKQLITIAGLLHSNLEEDIFYLKALQCLSNLSTVKFMLQPLDAKLNCFEHLDWLQSSDDKELLTKQLLPKYKGLYGPTDELGNLLLVEFHYTEIAYQNLITTNEVQYLNELVAIMYREPKANYDHARNSEGDHRVIFTDNDIAYHTKKVAKWPLAVKQAILMWYDGCRQDLVNSYSTVYPASSTKKDDNYSAGLYQLIRSLAGENYGTIDKVEQLTVHTAHLELSCMIADNEKLKEQLKSK